MKIADFGIACEEAYCDLLADDPGTYRWMAPEMIKGRSYGHKVDVYSFGLILWEMVAGTIPYVDMTPIQAAFAVVHKIFCTIRLTAIETIMAETTRPISPSTSPATILSAEASTPTTDSTFRLVDGKPPPR
ncbi:hypothetical protein RHMOL_Rhmol09G0207800 [Rhododendron molle]|uniref:Uncharacterized protein n=2 Tax=Rhododendron molle TaxID=49168 RepID=A0ACC0MHH0_RHOML|nr:hypothetical protein RHMOL_Rhmol09G0207800 [Rhododendron molle]KAI8539758.1 hypothetical protein RHMOL_Rhmol09G0207800 [Rhododendron molle]